MSLSIRWTLAAVLGWSCLVAQPAAAALSLEEAEMLSQQTGRPIFAVAGTET